MTARGHSGRAQRRGSTAECGSAARRDACGPAATAGAAERPASMPATAAHTGTERASGQLCGGDQRREPEHLAGRDGIAAQPAARCRCGASLARGQAHSSSLRTRVSMAPRVPRAERQRRQRGPAVIASLASAEGPRPAPKARTGAPRARRRGPRRRAARAASPHRAPPAAHARTDRAVPPPLAPSNSLVCQPAPRATAFQAMRCIGSPAW